MKKLLTLLILTTLAVPVAAEVRTYEDEYVSFQYDDEIEGFVDRYAYDGIIGYAFETDSGFCSIDIGIDEETANQIRSAISSGAVTATILVDNDDVIAIASYRDDTGSEFWPLLLESAKVQADCDFTTLPSSMALYRHYPFSGQAMGYAKAALEICNDYLSLKTNGKEAGARIKEIADKADSFSDLGDEIVYYAMSSAETYFNLGNDERIEAMKAELEMILAN